MKRKTRLLQYWAGMLAALLLFAMRGAGAQTYQGAGLVLTVGTDHNELVVSMQEIPGFMDAMVMPLPVRQNGDLQGLRPGMIVDFTLVVSEKSSYAENLRVRPFVSFENDPQGACRLAILEKALAKNPASEVTLAAGQHIPDFSLTDQNGQQVALSQFSGKVVAMTFVYTRCPLPNFCFRLSNNFGQIQKRFGKQMGQELILLTVTLDPINDQPNALAKYASIWRANGAAWHFLTGPAPTIKTVTGMFGVVSNLDEGTVTHSLHTVIIDRRGDLVANLEGNEFTGKQLGDLVEAVLNLAPDSSETARANLSDHDLVAPNSHGMQR
jgi:protein SCO1